MFPTTQLCYVNLTVLKKKKKTKANSPSPPTLDTRSLFLSSRGQGMFCRCRAGTANPPEGRRGEHDYRKTQH